MNIGRFLLVNDVLTCAGQPVSPSCHSGERCLQHAVDDITQPLPEHGLCLCRGVRAGLVICRLLDRIHARRPKHIQHHGQRVVQLRVNFHRRHVGTLCQHIFGHDAVLWRVITGECLGIEQSCVVVTILGGGPFHAPPFFDSEHLGR